MHLISDILSAISVNIFQINFHLPKLRISYHNIALKFLQITVKAGRISCQMKILPAYIFSLIYNQTNISHMNLVSACPDSDRILHAVFHNSYAHVHGHDTPDDTYP